MMFSTLQKLISEFVGTAFLLAVIVGSGIMAVTHADGNVALALLANAIATGAGLYVLITIFGPISGAHFNPAVTLAFLIRKDIGIGLAALFVGAQILGAVSGVIIAHAMFDLELLQFATKVRSSAGQSISEAVATFGLVLTILGCLRFRPDSVAPAVALFITAGYWFTGSTSFANPAVTLARTLTDTFTGIAYSGVPAFLLAEFSGAALAAVFALWLFQTRETPSP